MVDEFQDTNRLQLDVLEALERDNLFAVGDESQSIYGFRHADVEHLPRPPRGAGAASACAASRSTSAREPEILDVVNAAFAPAARRRASRRSCAGRGPDELRLFAPDPPEEPRVELLAASTAGWEEREAELGLAALAAQPWRRAEARAVAARLRAEVDAGRAAARRSSCSCARPARCGSTSRRWRSRAWRPTWSAAAATGRRSRSATALAYLGAARQPARRGGALRRARLAVLRRGHRRARAARRGRAARERRAAPGRRCAGPPPSRRGRGSPTLPAERGGRGCAPSPASPPASGCAPSGCRSRCCSSARSPRTGYDLAILARAGGDRRLANLRKLMRLAREYERAEGRDLRGFLAYAAAQDLAEAREGEAALESEGLDAVRLMTIHRAKGLEFPVVCVADLGRAGRRWAAAAAADRRRTAAPACRLATLAGGEPVPALGYDAIAAELAAAEAAEERRLLYVAATRAEERLILSGGDRHGEVAGAAPGRPAAGLARARAARRPARAVAAPARPARSSRCGDGGVAVRLVTPATLPPEARRAGAARRAAAAPGTALPGRAEGRPAGRRPQPAQRRLSYSSLQDYARCALPLLPRRACSACRASRRRRRRATTPAPSRRGRPRRSRRGCAARSSTRCSSGSTSRGPRRPTAEAGARARRRARARARAPTRSRTSGAQVAAFAASPLCARLAAARGVRREAGFAFALEPDGGGPLVTGFVDVLAREADGTALIVDYKTDRLGGRGPGRAGRARLHAPSAWSTRSPRCRTARRASRSPTACSSARASRSPRRSTQADAPALADALLGSPAACSPSTGRSPPRPHRELCGDCPGRAHAVLLARGDDAPARRRSAYASAGTLAGSGGPS